VVVLAMLADKDVDSVLELLEPVADYVVATRNTSPRALPAAALAERAAEILTPERVVLEPELPDAIAAAVALAEEDLDGEMGGVGVLITGSVVTVADARKLFRR
jgi:dihydrofolate synthase/folylpolyglutamate synthase